METKVRNVVEKFIEELKQVNDESLQISICIDENNELFTFQDYSGHATPGNNYLYSKNSWEDACEMDENFEEELFNQTVCIVLDELTRKKIAEKLKIEEWIKLEDAAQINKLNGFELIIMAQSFAKQLPDFWSTKRFNILINQESGTYNSEELVQMARNIVLLGAYANYVKN